MLSHFQTIKSFYRNWDFDNINASIDVFHPSSHIIKVIAKKINWKGTAHLNVSFFVWKQVNTGKWKHCLLHVFSSLHFGAFQLEEVGFELCTITCRGWHHSIWKQWHWAQLNELLKIKIKTCPVQLHLQRFFYHCVCKQTHTHTQRW